MPPRAPAPTVPDDSRKGPKGRAPHAALSGRADVSGSPRGSRGSRGRGGLPRGHRAQRARGRHLAALVRERGQDKDVLHLRRAQSGGDPKERRGQPPAGGRDDRGPRTGSLSVLLREEEPMLKRLFRPSPAMAVACLALFVGLGGTAPAAAAPSDPSVRFRYRPRWGVSAGLLVVALVALSLSATASAGTISVTTTFDQIDGSAPCSLREAVNTANADANSGGCTDANPAAADTIKLDGGDYNLQRAGVEDANASGDLDVTESLTIAGAGADESGIDGNGAITGDRVLQVSSGTLTISGLTVHDGFQGTGGGIRGESGTTLRLTNSTVSGNIADIYGGGIFTYGTATLTDSTVSGNIADISGGGIAAGTTTLTGSTVSGNKADG